MHKDIDKCRKNLQEINEKSDLGTWNEQIFKVIFSKTHKFQQYNVYLVKELHIDVADKSLDFVNGCSLTGSRPWLVGM